MKALLIDYGSGNLRSAAKALEAAGFSVSVSSDPRAHLEASLLVLPGQGHFGQVMQAFRNSGFVDRVLAHLERGLPFPRRLVAYSKARGRGWQPGFFPACSGSGRPKGGLANFAGWVIIK